MSVLGFILFSASPDGHVGDTRRVGGRGRVVHRRGVDLGGRGRPPRDPVPGRWPPGRRGRRGDGRRHRAGNHGRAALLRRRSVGVAPGRRARRAAAARGRPAAARPGPRRPGRDRRHREARRGERDRRRRRDGLLPLVLPPRGLRRRSPRRHREPHCPQPGGARAGRRRRPHHAVELPAAADGVEGRARPRRRVQLRAQAQRAHPAHRDHPARAARRGGRARRCRQPRAGSRDDGRGRRCRATPTSTS